MPQAPQHANTQIGLALSGGGFRATLYHAGALIRLNELGYLGKLDFVTSVSGGSITAGRLAVCWNDLTFSEGRATNLDTEVIAPLRAFCRQNIDVQVIGLGLIPFTKSGTERLIDAYDAQLMKGRSLADLPEAPRFVFKATNLQTGRMVRLSKRRIADYLVGEIRDTSKCSVARAVAASSAFPPVLSPVTLPVRKSDWSDLDGTRFFGRSSYMHNLNLTDGGVYDNLGLERIDRLGTILCSDAGKPFSYGASFAALSPKQILRSLDISMDQARALRTRGLFDLAEFTGQTVAYWGLDMGETLDPAPDLVARSTSVVAKIAGLRTRLNAFSEKEQGWLLNWGYASCDERMRSYVTPDAAPPTALPVPDVPLV